MGQELEEKIRTRTQEFVSELSQLIRDAAAEAAVQALRGTTNGAFGRAPPKAKGSASSSAEPGSAKGRGKRRSPKEIQRVLSKVVAYVEKNEGARAENIRKALGMTAAATGDALRRLLEQKALRSKGQRRSTIYSTA